ncbi:MAG: DUF1329 domain-containing protein [Spongiibacteraceae bacterium]
MKLNNVGVLFVVTTALAGASQAAVSTEEAKSLGGAILTEFGAERGASKDGVIPAYDPKPIKAPAGWDRQRQGYPDPWGEAPLFAITAQNAAQYADKLDGMIEVFKRYPNFRMDVYPTHRTAIYPKAVLENTVKNAGGCKTTNDDLNLVGCYGGIPFPIPKSGRQEMWNHLLGYDAHAPTSRHLQTWVIPVAGSPVLQSTLDVATQNPFYDPAKMGNSMGLQDLYYKAHVDFNGPARQAGSKLLVTYSVDTLNYGSRVWQYIPGQRRVKLAPDLAYDTPSPTSGGSATMDDQKGFLGALDRFDFKLVGKKEKYIMYNNFKLTDPRVCADNKVVATKYFADPACVRWELHRVWRVEATLKPGYRHIYAKRVFYWDEDTHTAGSTENYDASGKLYRVLNMIAYPYYEGGTSAQSAIGMDLQTGIWTLQGGMGTEGAAFFPDPNPQNATYFSPEALAGTGVR